MKVDAFRLITQALNGAGVHYLVVGGMAVVAHGHLRFTKDIDLVVRLTSDDIAATFRALKSLGYQPLVPITSEQFSDPGLRAQWRNEKGMVVLTFWSDEHPETPVDIFIYEPFDFAVEEAQAYQAIGSENLGVRFASISALICMKKEVGRPLDLDDVEKLQILADLRRS